MIMNGRWPSNFLLTHNFDCEKIGVKRVKPLEGHRPNPVGKQADGNIRFNEKPAGYQKLSYTDPGGLETVDDWICTEGCPVAKLGRQSGIKVSKWGKDGPDYKKPGIVNYTGAKRISQQSFRGDKGTAARFFFQADWSYERIELSMKNAGV